MNVVCFSESRRGDIDVTLAAHGHDSLGLNSALFAVLSVGRYTSSMINLLYVVLFNATCLFLAGRKHQANY